MTGGTVFTDPDEIRDGWELRLPNDATVPKIASPTSGRPRSPCTPATRSTASPTTRA